MSYDYMNSSYLSMLAKQYATADKSSKEYKTLLDTLNEAKKAGKTNLTPTSAAQTASAQSVSSDTKELWNQTLSSVKSAANIFQSAADALFAQGKDSLYTEKAYTKTDTTTGETVSFYGIDKETIYKTVNSFVSSYNAMLSLADGSGYAEISQSLSQMTSQLSGYADELKKIGISLGADGKLSVNNDTLETVEVSEISKIFQSTTGIAKRLSLRTDLVLRAAEKAAKTAAKSALRSSTYSNSGSYDASSAMNTNSLIDYLR